MGGCRLPVAQVLGGGTHTDGRLKLPVGHVVAQDPALPAGTAVHLVLTVRKPPGTPGLGGLVLADMGSPHVLGSVGGHLAHTRQAVAAAHLIEQLARLRLRDLRVGGHVANNPLELPEEGAGSELVKMLGVGIVEAQQLREHRKGRRGRLPKNIGLHQVEVGLRQHRFGALPLKSAGDVLHGGGAGATVGQIAGRGNFLGGFVG